MKPLKVVMSAFGSYAEVETVEFEKLDHGIFLITGDTGAGKTTIFDAVAFALFGETSGQEREGTMMRSQYATEQVKTYVSLTFLEKGEVYEITRSPAYQRKSKRKNKEGEYVLIQNPAKASLILPNGMEYPGNLKEINQKIQELVGVDQNQFSQIAMIAQGDYLKLLHATSKERKEIFSKIFDTGIYSQIQAKLKEKNGELFTKLESNKKLYSHELSNVELLEESYFQKDWQQLLSFPETKETQIWEILQALIEEIRKKEASIREQRENKRVLLSETEGFIRQAGEVNHLFDRIDLETAKQKELLSKETIYKDREAKLFKAKKAEQVKRVEYDLLDKKEQKKTANQQILELEEEINRVSEKAQKAKLVFVSWQKELQEKNPDLLIQIARLQEAMPFYEEWNTKKKLCEEIELQSKKEEEAIKLLEEKIKQIKQHQLNLEAEQEKTGKLADCLLEWIQKRDRLKEQKEGLKQIKLLLEELEEAERNRQASQSDVLKAQGEYEQAEALYQELYRNFLTIQAGVIAQKLEEGKPCPVCGSIHHPMPQKLSKEAVNQKKVEEAKEHRDRVEKNRSEKTIESMRTIEVCRNLKEQIVRESKKWIEEMTQDLDVTQIELAFTFTQCESALKKAEGEVKKAKEAQKKYKENQKIGQENKKQLENLEIEKEKLVKEWQENKIKLAKLVTERKQLEARLPVLEEEAKKELKRLQQQKKKLEREVENAREILEELENTKREKKGRLDLEKENYDRLCKEIEKTKDEFVSILQEQGFLSEEEYQEGKMDFNLIKKWEEESQAYKNEVLKTKTILEQLQAQTDGKSRVDIKKWQSQVETLQKEQKDLLEIEGYLVGIRSRNEQANKNIAELSKQKEFLKQEYQVIHTLYQTANGKMNQTASLDFQTYVQRQYFSQMIQAANRRLQIMTDGKFLLQCREMEDLAKQGEVGLDLDVYSMDTGKIRDVKTLSGGESFMAALCMALGMSDMIENTAGNVQMDAMFIDEGFGTLDEESRLRAIRILKELAGGHRLIGIISHVTELKEQIERKLIVEKNERGSKIKWMIETTSR